jgi:hypothetical protein
MDVPPHTQLVKADRFCFLLTKLADEDLPRLTVNPADVQALRDLRSRGDAMYRLCKSASSLPQLVNLAGCFSNGLARSARHALKNHHAHQLSLARIHLIADRVEECVNSPITFNLGVGVGNPAAPTSATATTRRFRTPASTAERSSKETRQGEI